MENTQKKTIQRFWTDNVPGWDVISKDYSPEQKEFYQAADDLRYHYDGYILPLLDSFVTKGIRILEIGCGMGSDSRQIARRGGKTVSLDLSSHNAYLTNKGALLFGFKDTAAVCADAEHLPFKDASFEAVYSFGVLHHTPDTQGAINEVYRVLKPQGRCLIMLYHKGYAYYLLFFMHIGLFLKSKIKGSLDGFMSKYDHTPLSRLYSRAEIKKLFHKFAMVKIDMTTYGGSQRHPMLRFIYRMLHRSKFLMNRFGSYLLIRGEK